MRGIMNKLTGWQLVALVGLVLAALVSLVAMGQELGAIVGAALLVLGGLGVPIVQNAINSEKINQGNTLANGNMTAMREQLDSALAQHAVERTVLQAQLQAANDRAVQLAAMIPPESKINGGA